MTVFTPRVNLALDKQRGNEMKVCVIDYPSTFSFNTRAKFPAFKYGCDERARILVQHMARQKVHSPSHAYEDYVIESIEIVDGVEFWHLGS